MGDPFSTSTGIAGLISLGLTLGNGLHTYFSAIKDRHSDIEIAQKSLGLLQFNIYILRSNQSRLGRRHGLAADGLTLGVINCEAQLRSLEILLNDLTSTEGSTALKQTLRKQKTIARYPFNQKKLVQLQDQLSKANATLNNFLSTLILESVLDISKDMEALKILSEARGTSTQTIPKVMAPQLNIIAPKEERGTLAIVSHSARRREQLPTISNDSTSLQQTGLNNREIELVSRSSARIFKQFIKAHTQPHYLQNTEFETRFCANAAASVCTCRASANNTGQLNQFGRGGLTIYKRGYTKGYHHLECPLSGTSQREASKVLLRLSWILSIVSKAFIVSVSREQPSGYYGISLNLRSCHIVESSPAFKLFFRGRYEKASGTQFKVLHDYYMQYGMEHMAESLIQQLRIIYASGKSSPFDVDEEGNTIAYRCVEVNITPLLLRLTCKLTKVFEKACHNFFTYGINAQANEVAMNVVCKLLSYMFDVGVPVNSFNFNQKHILDIVTQFRGLWLLPRLYGLISDRDRGFYSTELAHRQQHYYYGLSENDQMIEPLDAFCKYPEMSADLGFSDLFLTVINKDLWKLQAMLKDRAIDTKILQKDLYRRNILHASTDWPAGLKALLEHETVVCPLMNDLSCFAFTPLDHALCYSKYQCNAPDQWTVCYNCACFVPAQLLLEADCSVTMGWYRHKTLRNCSLRARMLFFQHMKNRRERLRQIAIRVLPSTFLERYQIDAQSLPDATAMVLWDELQQKKYERLRLAVGFSDSLEPHCGINPSSCRSFFGHLHHWKVAILACTYGFQPRDEHGVPTLLSRDLQSGCDEIEDFITYIDWLLQFNLELELYLGPFQLSALHRLAAILGNRIKHLFDDGESFPDSILTRTHVLFSAICSDESQSNVPCPCISSMFNRPVCYLISGMTAYSWVSDLEHFWENIHRTIDHVMLMLDLIENSTRGPGTLYLFKCTVHSLTMMCLDVRHLPICYARHSDPEMIMDLNLPECRQEWTEILDEDQWLIDGLNALDEEFSTAFERENVSIADFLRGYWLERMKEVIGHLHKPLTDQDRCDLHAIGVVLNKEETVNRC